MLYYNQAQSRQHPKRGPACTHAVLQSSTIQAASETRPCLYSCCTTIKHNPGSIRNEALPVLSLQYNQAQSRQHPKRGPACTHAVLQSSTIQAASETRALPVLMLYYNQAQSRQHPKRGPACTHAVLQSSTIQAASETRPCLYSCCTTIKHNPGSIRNEALPVLMLYYSKTQSRQHPKRGPACTQYNQAQSRQHPKRGPACTHAVLQSSTIQAASETRPCLYSCCTTIKHNPGSIRNEALPVLMLYYNQAQSRQHPKRGPACTHAVLQSSTIQAASETRPCLYSCCTAVQSCCSTIQAASETRPCLYSCCTTIKHNPGSIRNEALPVLMLYYMLYYNQAQSRQHPKRGLYSASTQALPVLQYKTQSRQHTKRGPACTHAVLQSSTIQAASETRPCLYSCCTTIKHNPGSIRNEALPVLMLYYNQAQSRQHPKRGPACTHAVLQSSTIQAASETRPCLYSAAAYNQAQQSRQHPKRGPAKYSCCTTVIKHNPGSIRNEALPCCTHAVLHAVLQSSTIQAASETRPCLYSGPACCTTIKHNPGSIRNEALPVLMLYYNQAQSRQHPKRGPACTHAVLQSSTIQAASETRPWPCQ